MSVDQYFDDLIDVLTPQCGWVGMNAQECVMQGCCWRSTTNKCVGALPAAEITEEKLEILRNADEIYIDEIKKAGLYDEIWQAFAVLLPTRSVGVMGDARTYEYVCALRAVTSVDGMTEIGRAHV